MMQTSVPLYVSLSLSSTLSHQDNDLIQNSRIGLGNRVEINLVKLVSMGRKDLAELLNTYYQTCQDFWVKGKGRGEFILLERELISNSQLTGKNKKDLVEEYEALTSQGGVGKVIEEATAATVNEELLDSYIANIGAYQRVVNDTQRVLVMSFPGGSITHPALGGVGTLGETARFITLVISHSAWRTRRVRRLSKIVVTVEERWPKVK